jgi:hypothetical protein
LYWWDNSFFSLLNRINCFCKCTYNSLINLISVIILITKKSSQQSNFQIHWAHKYLFHKQLWQHKHLLTAAVVLVILALSRLIIPFASKCMKSAGDLWLFLIGYFYFIYFTNAYRYSFYITIKSLQKRIS